MIPILSYSGCRAGTTLQLTNRHFVLHPVCTQVAGSRERFEKYLKVSRIRYGVAYLKFPRNISGVACLKLSRNRYGVRYLKFPRTYQGFHYVFK